MGDRELYIIKIDLPTGTAYFTGKKRVTQGCESPGLADSEEGACTYETADEATRMCKMLFRKFDMEFYYTPMGGSEEVEEEPEEEAFEEAVTGTADASEEAEESKKEEENVASEEGEEGGDTDPETASDEEKNPGQKKKPGKKKKKR